ncbi:MAG: hypothetical protein QG622_3702, partial [Actinomycetota bacterium]|nr:hypothetical protein [Actinomycetota bacterium]
LFRSRPAPARRSADRPGLPANAVRPVAPRPPDPLVPLALPVFFALLAALLLGEALWTTDGVSYWWAGGSCLAAATLTEVWRETGRHTDRAVH